MTHELKEKMKPIKEMKENLMNTMKMELAKGIQNVDTKEAGEVVDMIKDLAETEYYCTKSCYYETLMEAMEEEKKEEERFGYNNRRYASGRYAPSGRGEVSGYPMIPPMYGPMMDTIRMGYPMSTSSNSGSQDSSSRNMGGRSGYYPEDWADKMDTRYGKSYHDYQDARRHYTTSQSQQDKEEMERHANEHMNDTMMTIREIYKTSDPELKRRIKADLTKLIGEMPN